MNRKDVKAEMGAIGGVHEKEREGSNKNKKKTGKKNNKRGMIVKRIIVTGL